MPKKKILKKRVYSMKDIPIGKGFKTMEGLIHDSPATRMRDKEYVAVGLWECIKDNDVESFKEILRTHLELTNKDEFAKKTGIARRTLFRMLSPEGNPTFENVCKMVHALCA